MSDFENNFHGIFVLAFKHKITPIFFFNNYYQGIRNDLEIIVDAIQFSVKDNFFFFKLLNCKFVRDL